MNSKIQSGTRCDFFSVPVVVEYIDADGETAHIRYKDGSQFRTTALVADLVPV